MLNLILLGPPGAGKGTQASRLKDNYSIPHISTGDIFRKNIKEGTELGRKAQEYMHKGELVPDSLVVEIVKDRLLSDDCKAGFILDGFPRTIYQAEELKKFLSDTGREINKIINVAVGKDELISRLSGRRVCRACGATYHITGMPPEHEGECGVCGGELYQRDDDQEETVAHRIDVYNSQTKPLIDYYEKTGNVAHIDGTAALKDVFSMIVKAIEA